MRGGRTALLATVGVLGIVCLGWIADTGPEIPSGRQSQATPSGNFAGGGNSPLPTGLPTATTVPMQAAGESHYPGSGTERRRLPTERKQPRWKSVLIERVPHVRQKPDFCGEACAAMWLGHLGLEADQDWVFDSAGLDPLLARGCYTKELADALQSIGFRVGPVWYRISPAQQKEQIDRLWTDLHADLAAGIPSIVCMHYAEPPADSEHFRLVLGYDAQHDEVIYHEPADVAGAYRRMKRDRFLALWPLKYRPDRWTVIRLRLEAGRLKQPEPSTGFTAADFCQHMMKLRPKIPSDRFTVVIEPPFVVIGDEEPKVVRRRAKGTIRWAVTKLKEAYFQKDPPAVIDIWLFRNKESYDKHTKQLFGQVPSTPFGYYSSSDRALVMNIATGGGTLVHEIVHPFVEGDFPECPAWLNEGLGSLYEQCHESDGRIEGMTNWRLAGLQDAIRAGRLPSFHQLCSTSDAEFYRDPHGTNYAQARYLCYYLEQHRLLRSFYRRFRASVARDPTGYKTLSEVLGTDDMAAFQRRWEQYVLRLTFP